MSGRRAPSTLMMLQVPPVAAGLEGSRSSWVCPRTHQNGNIGAHPVSTSLCVIFFAEETTNVYRGNKCKYISRISQKGKLILLQCFFVCLGFWGFFCLQKDFIKMYILKQCLFCLYQQAVCHRNFTLL